MRTTRHLSLSSITDPGLSLRSQRTLDALSAGFTTTTVAQQPFNPFGATVDLSHGGNEVVMPEVLEFFKDVVGGLESGEAFTSLNGSDARLRDALAGFFNTYFAPVHPVRAEHVVLSAGTGDAIENVVYAVCDEGDGVLVPGPSWPNLPALLARKANITPIPARPPTYSHWANYLVPSLQAAYDFHDQKNRIKAVLLCNPNNPLGQCYPRETLLELMEFCQERGLHLVCDEGGGLMGLDQEDCGGKGRGGGGGGKEKANGKKSTTAFVSALALMDPFVPEGAVKVDPSRVHVVWSASKLFGLGGLKVSCTLSSSPHLLTYLTHTTPPPSPLSTHLLTSLLTSPLLPSLLILSTARLTSSYNTLTSFLRRHNIAFIVPTHGPFLFARLARQAAGVEEEEAFWREMDAGAGVRVRGGVGFGGVEEERGWARVRFSAGERVMEEVVARLEEFYGQGGG